MQHAHNTDCSIHRARGHRRTLASAALAGALLSASIARAEDAFTEWLSGGKANLTLNPRVEYGKIDGFESATAVTLKTLLGYTTADLGGLSAKVEFTDTHALDDEAYNAAGLNGQPTKTVIADPETTELNQLYLDYKSDAFGLRIGRQRYILDNARFVGNVGWRQNEQTFDAISASLPVADSLTFKAAYLHHINRIFADARDLDASSVLLNATLKASEAASLTAYYYHLDFDDAIVTTDTLGGFVTGTFSGGKGVKFDYRAELAFQSYDDADVDTIYYHLVLGAAFSGINLKAGYEVLGSDHGMGQFLTPLATAHAYNGFADTYLDNGGAGGLRDVYLSVGTKFGKLAATVFYHAFASDEGNASDGSEVDAVFAYPITPKTKALLKVAHYDGDIKADRERVIFQVTTGL